MARGGLYIDTLQPFGGFRRCLWFADRDLPYGEIAEVDEFSGILRDPQVTAIFENSILPQAASMPTITGNGPAGSYGQRKKDTPICRSILRPLRRAYSSGQTDPFGGYPSRHRCPQPRSNESLLLFDG